jgi:hypothetical protein
MPVDHLVDRSEKVEGPQTVLRLVSDNYILIYRANRPAPGRPSNTNSLSHHVGKSDGVNFFSTALQCMYLTHIQVGSANNGVHRYPLSITKVWEIGYIDDERLAMLLVLGLAPRESIATTGPI